MAPQYFTIVARNYVSYALVLQNSVLSFYPDAKFTIVIADAALEQEALDRMRTIADTRQLQLLSVTAIKLRNLSDMIMRYDVMEFATAIKPFIFKHLLKRSEGAPVIYLDPDILVTARLTPVLEALDSGADAVVTPHFLKPPPVDGCSPSIDDILSTGHFNLGFAAFANTDSAWAFLDWWAERCAVDCFSAPERGLFVDQKFVDQAPELIDNLIILNDPGCNVAYWNLHERVLKRNPDGSITADGVPLCFFHFSGIVPSRPKKLSKYQNRYRLRELGDVGVQLFRTYCGLLAENGHAYFRTIPYAWGRYPDGTPIPRAARRLYALRKDAGEEPKPFDKDLSYVNGPEPTLGGDGLEISRLMAEIWRERPDLQAVFDLNTEAGRVGMRRWFIKHGPTECCIGREHMVPATNPDAGLGTVVRACLARFLTIVRT